MKGILWQFAYSAYEVVIKDLVKQGVIKTEDAKKCLKRIKNHTH